ncbi:serine/threonine_protein [Hexamita inflata]|uniref:Serine/threonine_protein n=1 Tax=Hexamita inflata TaxID=28002 RepID=A0ABP1GWM0_9EUKA
MIILNILFSLEYFTGITGLTCEDGKIPNAANTECVSDCGIEFLNPTGTACVTSCFSISAVPDSTGRCAPCLFYISADQSYCVKSCPPNQISVSNTCLICSSTSSVPNLYKSACVPNTACDGYLNSKRTYCILNCAAELAYPDAQRQCQPCSTINTLGVWNSSCICSGNSAGTFPNCACANGFELLAGKCVCNKKLSSNGLSCSSTCGQYEIYNASLGQCVKCPLSSFQSDSCSVQTCSNIIFRNGAKFVYCVKGTQSNQQFSRKIQFASDSSFNGALIYNGLKMNRLNIDSRIINAEKQNFVGINMFSNVIVSNSKVQVEINSKVITGLHAFGHVEIRSSEINISATGQVVAGIGYQLSLMNQMHAVINLTVINITSKDVTNMSLIQAETSSQVTINNTVYLQILSTSSNYFGISEEIHNAQILNLKMNITVLNTVQYFYGLSYNCTILNLGSSLINYISNSHLLFCGISFIARSDHLIQESTIKITNFNGTVIDFCGLYKQAQYLSISQLVLNIQFFNGSIQYFYGLAQQVIQQLTITDCNQIFNVKKVVNTFCSVSQAVFDAQISNSHFEITVQDYLDQFVGVSEVVLNQLTVQNSIFNYQLSGDEIIGVSYEANNVQIVNTRFTGAVTYQYDYYGLVSYNYGQYQLNDVTMGAQITAVTQNSAQIDLSQTPWNIHSLTYQKFDGNAQKPTCVSSTDQVATC